MLTESLTEKLYDWGIRFQFPLQQGQRFFPICSFQMGSMSHPASHAVGTGAVSLGGTGWLGHLADHSHDVLRLRMHGRSYATNFPCVCIVWYLIKHRDNFNSAFVNTRNDQQWNLGLPENCLDALTGEPTACVHSCHVGSGLVAVLTYQEPVHMSISLQLCFKKLVNSYREHAPSYCHLQWVQFCDCADGFENSVSFARHVRDYWEEY